MREVARLFGGWCFGVANAKRQSLSIGNARETSGRGEEVSQRFEDRWALDVAAASP